MATVIRRTLTGKPEKLLLAKHGSKFSYEHFPFNAIASLEAVSEESAKRAAGTVGWGVAGGLALGPLGAVAGMLLGGNGKDVTFVMHMRDGRKLMARGPMKDFTDLKAQIF